MYRATELDLSPELFDAANRVCPFSDGALDEDAISELVHQDQVTRHEFLGSFTNAYAGRVRSDDYLMGSSSGGLTSWLAAKLFAEGLIDGVLNVGRTEPRPPIFSYDLVDADGARQRRKSQYYSTTLEEALGTAKERPGRYALVGVPCFIKAARLLEEQDPVLKERIVFHVGLVCGHMKSQFFGESMAWQLGIAPDDLADLDFRVKHEGRAVSDYDFAAQSASDGEWRSTRTKSLLGGSWGHGAFQPEACNFCDDIFAETADVAFGDAWLPQFRDEWRGTNVVVSRSDKVDGLFEAGRRAGEIDLDNVSAEVAASSQAGNFRHRRLGVSVRSHDDIQRGLSVPKKRVPPSLDGVGERRLKVIRARRRLSEVSFRAFREARERGDLQIYLDVMGREIAAYQKIYAPLWRRALGKLRSSLGSVARNLGWRK